MLHLVELIAELVVSFILINDLVVEHLGHCQKSFLSSLHLLLFVNQSLDACYRLSVDTLQCNHDLVVSTVGFKELSVDDLVHFDIFFLQSRSIRFVYDYILVELIAEFVTGLAGLLC